MKFQVFPNCTCVFCAGLEMQQNPAFQGEVAVQQPEARKMGTATSAVSQI